MFRLQNCLWIIKMNLISVNLICKIRYRNLKLFRNIYKKLNYSLLKKNILYQFWKVLKRSFMTLLVGFVFRFDLYYIKEIREWVKVIFFV